MQSLQISRLELTPPDGKDFWTEFQRPGAMPVFTAKEAAMVFFGRNKMWMLRQMQGLPSIDGDLIVIPRTKANAYQFQLAHIERIAHSLFERGIITYKTFESSLIIVKNIASNYRLL